MGRWLEEGRIADPVLLAEALEISHPSEPAGCEAKQALLTRLSAMGVELPTRQWSTYTGHDLTCTLPVYQPAPTP